MNMRRLIALVAGGTLALALGALPSSAGTTDSTFTLTSSDTLSVTVPDDSGGPIDLGSTSVPDTATVWSVASGTFGTVTVADERSTTLGWVATATGTDFCIDQDGSTSGVQCHDTDTNQKVLSTAITYTPGTLSVSLGDLSLLTGTPGTLSAGATVEYTGTGDSQVSWDPALDITLAETQVAGTYQGTITHNVS